MILQKELDHVSAKWDKDKDTWQVGQRTKYRWCYVDDTPASNWFYDIDEALDWIKRYDKKEI